MGQLVREIEKNTLEKIVATMGEFKGKQRIDIRIYFQDDNDEWRPTKKGINLGLDDQKEFKDLVGEIDQAIRKKN